MAVGSDSIWAVDLGNASLKALHLVAVGDAVQVIGFDHIPHGKILSASGVSPTERDELIAITLRQFVQRNDAGDESLIVSVPSQNSFARFVTLPPVEQKRIPEIVRFEAAQQIPFDINEVQWDYVMMTEPGSTEQKVGIFAIKNEVVKSALEHFERENLQVGYVQVTSMALYNYLLYDRSDLVRSDGQATVIVNVGADCTDLVVCTRSNVWQRCITTGGNAFTQAIAETFKLNFDKAEKLKRTAPVSKYARQIFQAMRPVFTDWAGEVQRSLGFFTSSNADVKVTRAVAMGGGTKLRGLTKYLQQTIEIPVEKPDTFKKLALAEGLSAAKFHESVADFGVVYGLGLQGIGLARIESNLLPRSMVRSMAWASKTRYFIAAAVMVLVFSLMGSARVGLDWVRYAQNGTVLAANKSETQRGKDVLQSEKGLEDQRVQADDKIKKEFERFKCRDVVPSLYEMILSALPNAKNNPAQKDLYEAYARGDAAAVIRIPRGQRKQVFVTHMFVFYSTDLSTAQFGETATARKDALVQQIQQDQQDQARAGGPASRDSRYGSQMVQTAATTVSADRGFVVQMFGYSPYNSNGKIIGDLLYPAGVEDKPSQWGFIQRLAHPEKISSDVNCPFVLYSLTGDHLKIERNVVDMSDNVPSGVGVYERIAAGGSPTAARTAAAVTPTTPLAELTLVDPVTREVIIAAAKRDAQGKDVTDVWGGATRETRDYWFRISFKIKWKESPEPPASATSATNPAGAASPTSATSSKSSTTTSRRTRAN